MIGRIAEFLRSLERDTGAEAHKDEEAMRLAAVALMVETAVMDGRFEDAERNAIVRLVGEHFGLASADAGALIAEAERAVAESSQLFRFTNAINAEFSHEQRVGLLEMMWEVAYADGRVDDFEENLLRRVAGLIYVTDRERGLARGRVRARLGLD